MKKRKVLIAVMFMCIALHYNLQINANAIEITFPNGGGLVSADGFDD